MKLTLVRHPQTFDNVKHIMAGHETNSRVTKVGKRQIELVAKRLAEEKFDIMYSSDLTRCKQLALAIKKLNPNLKLVFAKELRERHFGIFEGKTQKAFSKFESKAEHIDSLQPPQGESREQAAARMLRFIEKIEKQHEHALIITHGGIKRIFLNKTFKLKLTYQTNYNTGVSLVDFTTKEVMYLFDNSHLPPELHTK